MKYAQKKNIHLVPPVSICDFISKIQINDF